MIRLGFSTTEDAISKAIRFATQAKVSHAFLTFFDESLGIDVALTAEWDGLVIRPLDRLQRETEVIALLTPAVPLDRGLTYLANNYLSAAYDYGGLVGMIWVLICRALGRHPSNPLASPSALFCSEACTLALQHSRYPGADQLDPSCTSPQDLFAFLQAGASVRHLRRGEKP